MAEGDVPNRLALGGNGELGGDGFVVSDLRPSPTGDETFSVTGHEAPLGVPDVCPEVHRQIVGHEKGIPHL